MGFPGGNGPIFLKGTDMRVLINCERSGTIREAFAKKGHDTWSCDLEESDIPGNHIIGDALHAASLQQWDLMIAHPPCTFLCIANAIHYNREKWGDQKVDKRVVDQRKAILFFKNLIKCGINKVVIENPLPLKVLTNEVGKYDQIVHPYFFGNPFSKRTCLWVKRLPLLKPTNMVDCGEMVPNKKGGTNPAWSHKLPGNIDRARIRSKTFQGMADAMADQWGAN